MKQRKTIPRIVMLITLAAVLGGAVLLVPSEVLSQPVRLVASAVWGS